MLDNIVSRIVVTYRRFSVYTSIYLVLLLGHHHNRIVSRVKGVVACTCNPATLEAKFQNGVGSILVGGNSP